MASSRKDFNTDGCYIVIPTNVDGTYRKGIAYYLYDQYRWNEYDVNKFSSGCYPMATRNEKGEPLSLHQLKANVEKLIKECNYWKDSDTYTFKVARFPSHNVQDVAPMFAKAPKCMILPYSYKEYVMEPEGRKWWAG